MKKNRSISKTLYLTNFFIFLIITIVFISVSCIAIINSTNNALELSMTETAKLAANNVSKEFEIYKTLFSDIAKTDLINNKNVPTSTKISYLEDINIKYGEKLNCTIDVVYNSNDKSLIQKIDVSNYDFYQEALNGVTNISVPINITELNNELFFIFSEPIISDGSNIGVLFVTIKYDYIYNSVSNNRIGKTGSIYILDKKGYMIVHDDKSYVNVTNPYEESKTDKSKRELGELQLRAIKGETGFGEYLWNNRTKIAAFSNIDKDLGWSVFVATEKSEFTSHLSRSIIVFIVLAIMLLLVSGTIFYILSKKIINPILLIVKRMELLADGDLSTPVPDIKTNDETKLLHTAVVHTIKSLKEYITNINYVMTQIADNNLNIEVNIDYTGDFTEIKKSLTKIIEELNKNMKDINQVAEQVSDGANQISAGAQLLSQGATEQASSLEELSATINEVSENINLNSRETLNANDLTEKALEELQKGNKEMKEMLISMDEIKISSNEISKIIKLIEDIAFQTNILSLNAAVEAARAGAAGKGFSVVADEVRNLANKSAEAARSTTILIEKALSAVSNGIEIADVTASSLNLAVELSQNVSNIMRKIAVNSNELTVSISQILEGTEQISAVVQTNSATAEESAASSEELSSQAAILKQMIEKYNLK